MRKNQKESLLGLTDTLAEAHAQIIKQIDEGGTDTALDLLQQCQEGAISMGTAIEESEGEGFTTVHYLEDYCETAYSIADGIAKNDPMPSNKLSKIAFCGAQRSQMRF